jgi:hypothetical protein
VTQASGIDDAFERWLAVVDRKTRRHRIVDRTLSDDRSGVFTIPIRFFFKVLEIGPGAAFRLALAVVANKLGRR